MPLTEVPVVFNRGKTKIICIYFFVRRLNKKTLKYRTLESISDITVTLIRIQPGI